MSGASILRPAYPRTAPILALALACPSAHPLPLCLLEQRTRLGNERMRTGELLLCTGRPLLLLPQPCTQQAHARLWRPLLLPLLALT